MGRFCGNISRRVPRRHYRFITPAEKIRITYLHRKYPAGLRKFAIRYKVNDCGGIITTSPGVITSPNYPNNYPHDTDCGWILRAPEGSVVILKNITVEIEKHVECRYDYLLVKNGPYQDSPAFPIFCGNKTRGTIRSSGSQLRLEFSTDMSVTKRGFIIHYEFSSTGCGGTHSGTSGVITSPNYPNNYPRHALCHWHIVVPISYYIGLNFTVPFDIETNPSCRYDYVEALDSDNNSSLGRFCGHGPPRPIQSSLNMMTLIFHTDSSVASNGFSASWKRLCGGNFTSGYGQIRSPNYPKRYPNNIRCVYWIKPKPGQIVSLRFDEFDLERKRGPNCLDYLQIVKYTGRFSRPLRRNKYCGKTKIQTVVNNGPIRLDFHTDRSIRKSGFVGSYFVETCGGNFTNVRYKYIKTPGYPSPYLNLRCKWTLTAAPNRSIVFKVLNLDLSTSIYRGGGVCQYSDALVIYDGNDTSSPILANLCHKRQKVFFKSTGQSMTIALITRGYNRRATGFHGTVKSTVGEEYGCGGQRFVEGGGTIQSVDLNGDGVYDSELTCVWKLIGPPMTRIRIQFSNFSLEGKARSRCVYDYLEIRDGRYTSSPQLGQFCGQGIPPVITSSSPFMVIGFVADQSVASTGFKLTYSVVSGGPCFLSLNATNTRQEIKTPNYPNYYDSDLQCRWDILAPPGKKILITVVDTQILPSENCSTGDILTIMDTPMTLYSQRFHICSNTSISTFESTGRHVIVRFLSSGGGRRNLRGAHLYYEIETCNKTLSGTSGRLTSPGRTAEASYRNRIFCNTTIITPSGNHIQFYFKNFSLESGQNCPYDYIQIFGRSDLNNSLVALTPKYCGSALRPPIAINVSTAYVIFRTDTSVTATGYDITYVSSSNTVCGGHIALPTGAITSPSLPSATPTTNTQCTWTIEVPSLHYIRIEISSLNLPCNFGSLKVTTSDRTYVYCDTTTVIRQTLSSKSFTVKYKARGRSRRFRLVWTVMPYNPQNPFLS